jgi:hypothetical protein
MLSYKNGNLTQSNTSSFHFLHIILTENIDNYLYLGVQFANKGYKG